LFIGYMVNEAVEISTTKMRKHKTAKQRVGRKGEEVFPCTKDFCEEGRGGE